MKKKIQSPLIIRLRKVATEWMKSAAWYRGNGFENNDPENVARRQAIADTMESDAMTLRRIIQ